MLYATVHVAEMSAEFRSLGPHGVFIEPETA
jgi:hypothetical protein